MMKILLQYKVPVAILLIIATLNLSIGCNYYKVRSIEQLNAELSKEQLQTYQNLNKYIVLHAADANYHIILTKLDSDKNQLEFNVSPVDKNHFLYSEPGSAGRRYKSRTEKAVLNEVHLFTNTTISRQEDGKASIPLSSLVRMDIIQADNARTIASYVFGIAGISVVAFGLILLLILLTKSSCPFVYIHDGKEFRFAGEMYGGAIFRPLQRDDYMFLGSVADTTRTLQIKISNELKEIQYTDLAELILTERDRGSATGIDSKGRVYVLGAPQSACKAMLNNNKEVSALLQERDRQYCLFDDPALPGRSNAVDLEFLKPAGARNGRLLIDAKNSWWLDFAFTKFTELFGSQYSRFIEKQRSAPRDSMLKWQNGNGLPLSVFLKEGDEWTLVEQIPTVGPLALRNFCVPLDFSKVDGDTIQVRLRCGFLNWEADAVAMDFSPQEAPVQHTLKAAKAIDQDGADLTASLFRSDGNYLLQEKTGQACTVYYEVPALKKGKMYDVYLHSNGYYEHVREYSGIPDRKLLESFKKPGAFNEFMFHLYQRIEALDEGKNKVSTPFPL